MSVSFHCHLQREEGSGKTEFSENLGKKVQLSKFVKQIYAVAQTTDIAV